MYSAKRYTEALDAYQELADRFNDSLAKVMIAQCQANVESA
jgi:hypothetical protein